MSATIDPTPFLEFFQGAQKVDCPGRLHPVALHFTPKPEVDFLEAAMICVLQIHLERPPGDVLVFLPGQGEIEGLMELLEAKRARLQELKKSGDLEGCGSASAAAVQKAGDLTVL